MAQRDPWADLIEFEQMNSAQAEDEYPNIDFGGGTVTFEGGEASPEYTGERGLIERPATDLALQQDRFAAPDEDIVFGDEAQSPRALQLRPEQDHQIYLAARAGDAEQVQALARQFTGRELTPESVNATIEYMRKHPNEDYAALFPGGIVNNSQAERDRQRYADIEKYGQYADSDPQALRDERALLGEDADAFARGGALGFDDEIDGVVGALLYGGGDPNAPLFDRIGDQMQRARRIRDYDEENNPYARLAGSMATSAFLPTRLGGGIGGLRNVARPAAASAMREALAAGASRSAARDAARFAAQRAIRVQLAKEGAGYGAAYSAGDTDGGPGERLVGALEGGALGAVSSYGLGAAGTAASNLRMRPTLRPVGQSGQSDAQQFRNAADRQNVEYLAADVPGAYPSQVASAVANSTLGAPYMAQGAERAITSLDNAASRVAGDIGDVAADETGLGQSIQRGLRTTMPLLDERTTRLYDAIPIGPDTNAVLNSTRTALTELTAGFKSNPALSKIWADNPRLNATLQALKGDKGLSWEDLKALRTNIGHEIGQPTLTSSGPERQALRGLYAALSEDMRATATSQGPSALRAFERANSFNRAKQARLDNIYRALLGDDLNQSPEKAVQTLVRWGQRKGGDFGKLAQALRSLPDEEAQTVKATLFDTLGNANPGAQNRDGDLFSPNTFLTNWNKLSPRAQNALFGGQHAEDVRDIVRLAEGMKASTRFANTSRTALGINVAQGVGLSGGVGFLTNPVGGALSIAGQLGLGKLMSDPRFAKWLARLGKKPNPQAVRAHVRRLGRIARSAPYIENDLFGLQQQIEDMLSMKPEDAPKLKVEDAEG